jgi:thymidylate synthase (FAD)
LTVELIDCMGDDLTVVNAARVSFDKESGWIRGDDYYDNVLGDKDVKLIKYLAKNNHWTPFSHCMITLRETVPIFVARQRFKHTVGFSYNEISRRYVDTPPSFFIPEEFRGKAKDKKQGSSDEVIPVNPALLREFYDYISSFYEARLKQGICPEQARMFLPQSMYTSYYVTGSLAAFARAYKLRSDSHAQKEIQELASEWDAIIAPIFPVSWKALTGSESTP